VRSIQREEGVMLVDDSSAMTSAIGSDPDLLFCSLAVWTLTHADNSTPYPQFRHSRVYQPR
jgi:hypothetical protein